MMVMITGTVGTKIDAATRTSSRGGIERTVSTTRIMTASTQPPKNPATAPHAVPTVLAISAAANPTSRVEPPRQHEAAEHVVAGLVGPEQVGAARPQGDRAEVGRNLVGVVDQRAENAEEHHEAQDAGA